MSFSSRRRNYLLTPHRRDGLIEWMKSMLQHSFVLDALETTGADTFSHFEMLIEEHRELEAAYIATNGGNGNNGNGGISINGTRHNRSNSICATNQPSRLRQLVPTIGSFHTPLPLREAFEIYNEKHQLTKRKHIQISFNEIRHILNLAQIIAIHHHCQHHQHFLSTNHYHPNHFSSTNLENQNQENHWNSSSASSGVTTTATATLENNNHQLGDQTTPSEMCQPKKLKGPRLITFDGDQTLYSDGANFESNPHLANYLYQLLRHQVTVAVVTAAGYEYNVEKYEYRLSGLLHYFQERGLTENECESFYLFGGECNFLLQLGSDYKLHAVRESGPGGWYTATQFLYESPGNWPERKIQELLDVAERTFQATVLELNLRGTIIRKKRSVGLIPSPGREITRESLDESVLRVHEELHKMNGGTGPALPYCAFNGGLDTWVDVGNKRVGVQVLQAYLGVPMTESLHIGDQFLNTGNDYAARDVSPCVWIINPNETTYVLKSILRLAGVDISLPVNTSNTIDNNNGGDDDDDSERSNVTGLDRKPSVIDFEEIERRRLTVKVMDVYTGELVTKSTT